MEMRRSGAMVASIDSQQQAGTLEQFQPQPQAGIQTQVAGTRAYPQFQLSMQPSGTQPTLLGQNAHYPTAAQQSAYQQQVWPSQQQLTRPQQLNHPQSLPLEEKKSTSIPVLTVTRKRNRRACPPSTTCQCCYQCPACKKKTIVIPPLE